jgi:1-deoxy-D-xylulose-5-phosphate synthase
VLLTVEEGAIGGFGSHVAQLLAEEGALENGLRFRSMVLPDTFIDQASPAEMYRIAQLDAGSIERKVLTTLGVTDLASRRA